VWVISDDQPGHYNLSRGVVAALRRIQPVQEDWVKLKLRVGLARNFLRAYLNHADKPGSPAWLRLFYRMDQLPRGGCDLIVSAGGKTSFASAWLAQYLNVPNVYAGSLRRLSPRLFSVVLTLEPIEGAASNLVVDLPPSAVDFDDMQSRGQRLLDRLESGGQQCWALLIGGNGAGYEYRQRDWQTLVELMHALARRYGIRWLLASSRRTGGRAERLLRQCLDSSLVADASWYEDGQAFSAEVYLGAAERVFVTEDSMTMLTEAIYSRRPVVSLRPRRAGPTDRYARMLQSFSESGYLCRHALAELVQQPEMLERLHCRVIESSPLDGLAEQLAKRLGMARPDFSQP
jgi:mitochondrial fission protein ELM1